MDFPSIPSLGAAFAGMGLSVLASQLAGAQAHHSHPLVTAGVHGMSAIMGVGAYPGAAQFFGDSPDPKPGPKDWSPRSGRCGCRKEIP